MDGFCATGTVAQISECQDHRFRPDNPAMVALARKWRNETQRAIEEGLRSFQTLATATFAPPADVG